MFYWRSFAIAQDDKLGFIGMTLCGRAGACSRRFRPLREGAVKCTAFDWGRDFSVFLPPSFACGKSHPLTAAVSLCRFATSPSHCEGVDPNKWGGLRNGQDRSLRVVGAIQESPACHAEPLGEESHIGSFYFVLLEILRFAQDDKLGLDVN